MYKHFNVYFFHLQSELDKMKEMFMTELRAAHEAREAAESRLVRLEGGAGRRTRGSNLGEMQDDTDNERENLRAQREEVAHLREQLEDQVGRLNTVLKNDSRKSNSEFECKLEFQLKIIFCEYGLSFYLA